jgi:predicted ArsR family transcriptional regulator
VLLAIVQVGGLRDVAESLGIAESTVKSHLHRLFAKTGTSARPSWSSSWPAMPVRSSPDSSPDSE